jgi:hypothetical protein
VLAFTLEAPTLDRAVYEVSGTNITMKNATVGDFGLDFKGNLFWTSPDCSYTVYFHPDQNLTTNLNRRASTEATARNSVIVDLTIYDDQDMLNNCPVELSLMCNDLLYAQQGQQVWNELTTARWVGSCPYSAADDLEHCTSNAEIIHSIRDIKDNFKDAFELVAGIFQSSGVGAACLALQLELAVSLGIVLPPNIAVAFYLSCYTGVQYTLHIAEDKVWDAIDEAGFNIPNICAHLTPQRYEIAVIDANLPNPTLFVTTVTGANPADIVTAVQIVDFGSSSCSKTTSATPTSTPGTIGPCKDLPYDFDGLHPVTYLRNTPLDACEDGVKADFTQCLGQVEACDAAATACQASCNPDDDYCPAACSAAFDCEAILDACEDQSDSRWAQCTADYADQSCFLGSRDACYAVLGDLCLLSL